MDCRTSMRLKTGHDDGFSFVARDPFIRTASDDGGDMPGPDKCVQAHIRRIEDGADGRNDRNVIRENREIPDAFPLGPDQGESGGRGRRFKADGEEHHVPVRILLGEL